MTTATRLRLGPWIGAVALAEAIGMTAAAGASALAATVVPAGDLATGFGLTVTGGLVEGAALGLLPAIVLRRWRSGFRSLWWAISTIVVAGIGWTVASLPATLSESTDSSEPTLGLVLTGALALGFVMGGVLGAAQSPAFRDVAVRPLAWIGVSIAAWTPGMLLIFAGATLPDASWAPGAIVVTGTVTGLVAGAVIGAVSGLLFPALDGRSASGDIVLRVLESRGHRLMSARLVGLTVTGRRSGREFVFPVSYREEAGALLVTPGGSERKTWWRNLVGGAPVRVLLRGSWRDGRAVVEPRPRADPLVRISLGESPAP
jgi:hypothetical protein